MDNPNFQLHFVQIAAQMHTGFSFMLPEIGGVKGITFTVEIRQRENDKRLYYSVWAETQKRAMRYLLFATQAPEAPEGDANFDLPNAIINQFVNDFRFQASFNSWLNTVVLKKKNESGKTE